MFFQLKKYFETRTPRTAENAKERLTFIIVQRCRHIPFQMLQKDLLSVVRKYVFVQDEDIKVNLEKQGNYDILELNIVLPKPER